MDLDEHREVIRRLFTLTGRRAEAAGHSAGDGQAVHVTSEQAVRFGNDLVIAGQEIAVSGKAIVLLAAGL